MRENTMQDLLRQANWMGHTLTDKARERVIAGRRVLAFACITCGKKLAVEGAYHGSAYNEECGRTGTTLYFR